MVSNVTLDTMIADVSKPYWLGFGKEINYFIPRSPCLVVSCGIRGLGLMPTRSKRLQYKGGSEKMRTC